MAARRGSQLKSERMYAAPVNHAMSAKSRVGQRIRCDTIRFLLQGID